MFTYSKSNRIILNKFRNNEHLTDDQWVILLSIALGNQLTAKESLDIIEQFPESLISIEINETVSQESTNETPDSKLLHRIESYIQYVKVRQDESYSFNFTKFNKKTWNKFIQHRTTHLAIESQRASWSELAELHLHKIQMASFDKDLQSSIAALRQKWKISSINPNMYLKTDTLPEDIVLRELFNGELNLSQLNQFHKDVATHLAQSSLRIDLHGDYGFVIGLIFLGINIQQLDPSNMHSSYLKLFVHLMHVRSARRLTHTAPDNSVILAETMFTIFWLVNQLNLITKNSDNGASEKYPSIISNWIDAATEFIEFVIPENQDIDMLSSTIASVEESSNLVMNIDQYFRLTGDLTWLTNLITAGQLLSYTSISKPKPIENLEMMHSLVDERQKNTAYKQIAAQFQTKYGEYLQYEKPEKALASSHSRLMKELRRHNI